MTRAHQSSAEVTHGDRVMTPAWVAHDLVRFFAPHGVTLEPCRGDGAIYDALPEQREWCEITEGRDFFDWTTRVDWIVTNPPYSQTRAFMRHAFAVSNDVVLLVPMRNIVSGYGTVRLGNSFGGMRNIRWYGTGSKLGFPMGNAIAAVHWSKGYAGPTTQTFVEDENRFPISEAPHVR